MEAILRSRGTLAIVMASPSPYDVALQTARNLYQYFRADTEILDSATFDSNREANIVQIALGPDLVPSSPKTFPIQVDPSKGVCIRDCVDREHLYRFQAGLGIAMLRPLAEARLEMVIWGFDVVGLRQAVRLLPLMTGSGQPDFVLVSKQCAWRGAAGVLAMGFLDSSWRVSQAAYLA